MSPVHRFCKACDYDLSAAAEPRCPECGRGFDPADARSYRAFSRRSWRGRWRRWRWWVLAVALVGALWPRGWVLTRLTWTDPLGKGSAETSALVIGRPWWLKGWWPPVTWSATTGGEWQGAGMDTPIAMVDALWMSDGARLWKSQYLGQGRLGVLSPSRTLRDSEWATLIKAYVHDAAAESVAASARDQGMSISAPVPPWMDRPGRSVP